MQGLKHAGERGLARVFSCRMMLCEISGGPTIYCAKVTGNAFTPEAARHAYLPRAARTFRHHLVRHPLTWLFGWQWCVVVLQVVVWANKQSVAIPCRTSRKVVVTSTPPEMLCTSWYISIRAVRTISPRPQRIPSTIDTPHASPSTCPRSGALSCPHAPPGAGPFVPQHRCALSLPVRSA